MINWFLITLFSTTRANWPPSISQNPDFKTWTLAMHLPSNNIMLFITWNLSVFLVWILQLVREAITVLTRSYMKVYGVYHGIRTIYFHNSAECWCFQFLISVTSSNTRYVIFNNNYCQQNASCIGRLFICRVYLPIWKVTKSKTTNDCVTMRLKGKNNSEKLIRCSNRPP